MQECGIKNFRQKDFISIVSLADLDSRTEEVACY